VVRLSAPVREPTTARFGDGRQTIANLKDVARLAEVDPSTASRVLRGDPAQHVRPETRQRILDAARHLEYRPNALARSLRTRRTGTIGLVIPSLDNVGFADVTHGIQIGAARAGMLLLVVEEQALGGGGDGRSEVVYERLVGDGLVDGLIVAFATLQDRHLARLAERGIPLVLVNRRTLGLSGSVVVDDQAGARLAVEHLAGQGHSRIGYLGLAADTDTAQRRRDGYRDGLAAAGRGALPTLEESTSPTVEGGFEGIGRLLDRTPDDPPTAIFVASLMSALGVRSGLIGRGMRIPEDVSVVAFNDHPIAEHISPPLTTIRMPNLEMGEAAVHMLEGAIAGMPVGDVMISQPPQVIVRGSTAPPRRRRRRAARAPG
jgi:LacI family transcriptional regulator